MNSRLSLLVSVVVLGASTTVSANDLAEAFKAGTVSGDVSITYESRNQKDVLTTGGWQDTYYADTAYSVGSVGLNYDTGKFHNFSASIGFRAYSTLWEQDENFKTLHGTGDASERFYQDEDYRSMVANAYLAYDTDTVHVKAGRQILSTEWLTKYHDAATVYYTPVENAEIEMIWSKRRGRAYARDLRPMVKINDDKGIYKLGVSYKFNDMFKSKVYALSAPDAYDIYGAKVNVDSSANDVTFGGLAHYMQTKEDVLVEDGDMIELTGYVGFAGYKATLGYVKTDEKGGWGSAANAGDTVVPFEEGDQMYVADAQTTYLMVSKSVAGVSLTGLYGITEYGQFEKSEFDLWAGYGFTKDLSLNVGFTMTDEDEKDATTTDMTQLNATLAYKF